ncbi:hypothetical protein TrRE_jg13601, partial [Triparma retinervis]
TLRHFICFATNMPPTSMQSSSNEQSSDQMEIDTDPNMSSASSSSMQSRVILSQETLDQVTKATMQAYAHVELSILRNSTSSWNKSQLLNVMLHQAANKPNPKPIYLPKKGTAAKDSQKPQSQASDGVGSPGNEEMPERPRKRQKGSSTKKNKGNSPPGKKNRGAVKKGKETDPLKQPEPPTLPLHPDIHRKEFFGLRDPTSRVSVALWLLPEKFLRLLHKRTDEERKRWRPDVRIQESGEEGALAEIALQVKYLEWNLLFMPSCGSGDHIAKEGVAFAVGGNYAPDTCFEFKDANGRGTCTTMEMIAQALGGDLDPISLFSDLLQAPIAITQPSGRKFNSERHVRSQYYIEEIRPLVVEVLRKRMLKLQEAGHNGMNWLLFGKGKHLTPMIKEAAEGIEKFPVNIETCGHFSALAYASPNITEAFAKQIDEAFNKWKGWGVEEEKEADDDMFLNNVKAAVEALKNEDMEGFAKLPPGARFVAGGEFGLQKIEEMRKLIEEKLNNDPAFVKEVEAAKVAWKPSMSKDEKNEWKKRHPNALVRMEAGQALRFTVERGQGMIARGERASTAGKRATKRNNVFVVSVYRSATDNCAPPK